MFIMNQEKTIAIKLNNVESIEIRNDDLYSIYVTLVNKEFKIGSYDTYEKAYIEVKFILDKLETFDELYELI